MFTGRIAVLSSLSLLGRMMLAASGAASAGAATPSQVIVAEGSVIPAGHERVSAFAQPTSEALTTAGNVGVRLRLLGSSVMDSVGHYQIRAALAELPTQYVRNDGGVDVLLIADNGVNSLQWMHTLFPASVSAPGLMRVAEPGEVATVGRFANGDLAAWTDFDFTRSTVAEVGISPGDILDGSGKAASAQSAAVPVHLADHSPLTDEAANSAPSTLGGAQTTSTSQPSSLSLLCGNETWGSLWKYGVKETFLKAYSVSGVPITVSEGTSGSTTHTLGVLLQDQYGALSANGTTAFTASSSASQSNVVDAAVSNSINYRTVDISCASYSYWKPYSVYGLLSGFDYAGHVDFSTCISASPGYQWTTSGATNATWSVGVAFPGLSVSAQAGYGTSVAMTYNSNVSGHLCGSSSQGPAASAQVSAKL